MSDRLPPIEIGHDFREDLPQRLPHLGFIAEVGHPSRRQYASRNGEPLDQYHASARSGRGRRRGYSGNATPDDRHIRFVTNRNPATPRDLRHLVASRNACRRFLPGRNRPSVIV
jgi:hypothetical protein